MPDQAVFGSSSDDIFGVENLGLEWRRKDLHYTWYADDGPIAHVGLVNGIIAELDQGETLQIRGIGGLVTRLDRRRQGYAQRLLVHALSDPANSFADDIAMLFCRPELIGFYRRQGWRTVDGPVWTRQGNTLVQGPLRLMFRGLRSNVMLETIGGVTLSERHW